MKNKYKVSIVLFFITVTVLAFVLKAYPKTEASVQPEWYRKKLDVAAEREKENKRELEAHANDKFTPDYEKLNEKQPGRNDEDIEIQSADRFPIQIPTITASEFKFVNVALTKFDIIIAGALAEDPTTGVFLDTHTDLSSGHISQRIVKIPGHGSIKIESIEENHNDITFITQDGMKGKYTTADGKFTLN